jgi:hypothetical protein
VAASITLTREQRIARARKAARTRTSVDHHIAKVVESARALTDEQVEQLRSLLPEPSGRTPDDRGAA